MLNVTAMLCLHKCLHQNAYIRLDIKYRLLMTDASFLYIKILCVSFTDRVTSKQVN